MGRASRKHVQPADRDGLEPGGARGHWTDTHPDRHLWSAGRLAMARMQTEEEYEALYGRGSSAEPPPPSLRSTFFPGISELPKNYESADRLEIISKMEVPEDTDFELLRQDPVLDALWDKECKRIAKEREWFQAQFPEQEHWSEDLPRLHPIWKNHIVRSWFWGNGDKVVGPELGQGAFRRVQILPSSYLAAAIEDNPLVAERFAQNLREIRKQGLARDFFNNSILPEIRYLTDPHVGTEPNLHHVLGPALAREIWEAAAIASGDREYFDISANALFLEEIVERGGGNVDALRTIPIAPSSSVWFQNFGERAREKYGISVNPTPRMEALYSLNWQRFERDSRADALDDAARDAFVKQIIRVYYGLDTPKEELGVVTGWEEYRKDLQGFWSARNARSPLENLRPIFRGEDKEELLDELIDYYRDQSRLPASAPPIAHLLQNHFGLHAAKRATISEEIFRCLGP